MLKSVGAGVPVAAAASASLLPSGFFLSLLLGVALPLLLYRLYACFQRVDEGLSDLPTRAFLSVDPASPLEQGEGSLISSQSVSMVELLEKAPVTDSEGECAEQMRAILTSTHALPYETLITEPELLLRCSPGMSGSHGAIWTRFTVRRVSGSFLSALVMLSSIS